MYVDEHFHLIMLKFRQELFSLLKWKPFSSMEKFKYNLLTSNPMKTVSYIQCLKHFAHLLGAHLYLVCSSISFS